MDLLRYCCGCTPACSCHIKLCGGQSCRGPSLDKMSSSDPPEPAGAAAMRAASPVSLTPAHSPPTSGPPASPRLAHTSNPLRPLARTSRELARTSRELVAHAEDVGRCAHARHMQSRYQSAHSLCAKTRLSTLCAHRTPASAPVHLCLSPWHAQL